MGQEVRTITPGQFVVGSFWASDNTCETCRAGYQSACVNREPMGALGAQAELLRVPLADGTLVATPDLPADDLVPGLLAASDVLATGWFAAVAAEAGPGKTVAVVGDGAVGLLAVLAAEQLGAERIIAISRHEPRQQLAREYGATDIVEERGDDGAAAVKELTNGLGAHSVIEAVGTQESMLQARVRPRAAARAGRRRLRGDGRASSDQGAPAPVTRRDESTPPTGGRLDSVARSGASLVPLPFPLGWLGWSLIGSSQRPTRPRQTWRRHVEERSKLIRTSEYEGPSVIDAATANRADSVRTSDPSPTKSVERLVADGMSRLSAERAVAIQEGAAEPSRARRHGRSGL